MPALNFQNRFADQVESGQKRQTIRLQRKRPIVVNDKLYLYTGMRTKHCRKLGETYCRQVTPIKMGRNYVHLMTEGEPWDMGPPAREWFARRDGFDSWKAMCQWFSRQHGLPFEGVLIVW